MRAVVDIGSNSVKYTLAEIQRGVPVLVKKKSKVTRLGRGIDKTGLLSPEAVSETEEALKEFARALAPYRAGLQIQVVATSAVRDSRNPDEISSRVERILGVPLRILSGAEEARYSLEGAAASAELFYNTRACIFVDVGGASTEVGIVEPSFEAFSFQAGGVRCHERLGLDQIPVTDTVWQSAQKGIGDFFPADKWGPLAAKIPPSHRYAVAVGGSLLVAARLAGAQVAEAQGQNLGYLIALSQITAFNEKFRRLSMEERMSDPSMEKGRADILCAGLLCLCEVLQRLKMKEVFITDWGLRHGLLMNPIS